MQLGLSQDTSSDLIPSLLDTDLHYMAYDDNWDIINGTEGDCGSFLECNVDFCGIIDDYLLDGLEMICITIDDDQCTLINDNSEEVQSIVDVVATGSSLAVSMLANIGFLLKMYRDKYMVKK